MCFVLVVMTAAHHQQWLALLENGLYIHDSLSRGTKVDLVRNEHAPFADDTHTRTNTQFCSLTSSNNVRVRFCAWNF
jgi:hypothetical protein